MRKKYIILIGGISLLFLTGCVSSKKMTYMYKGEKVLTGNQTSFLYDARIMPKDLLTITVSYSEPELAAPFNMGGSIANPLGGVLRLHCRQHLLPALPVMWDKLIWWTMMEILIFRFFVHCIWEEKQRGKRKLPLKKS